MVDLSKFTSNKQILSGIVVLDYNLICCQILFFKYYGNCYIYNITHVIIIFKRKKRFFLIIYLFIYGGRLLKHKLFDSGRLPSLQWKTQQITFIKKSNFFFQTSLVLRPYTGAQKLKGKKLEMHGQHHTMYITEKKPQYSLIYQKKQYLEKNIIGTFWYL